MKTTPDFEGRWVHFIETAYGAWLDGDARGFRTRHHREHVEGDYKNPPPLEMYAARRQQSRDSLKQEPVTFTHEWKPRIGTAMRDKLNYHDVFVLCLAVGRQHVHVLGKLESTLDPRLVMGLAKKNVNFEMKSQGWTGKLWAIRGKEIRIRDREHQVNVYHYILDHIHENAWVWKWERPPTQSVGLEEIT